MKNLSILKCSLLIFTTLWVGYCLHIKAEETNPEVITSLLNRIGGEGTASRFVTIVDTSISTSDKDAFIITSKEGKPCIKGSSIIAVTTGINWYLNHIAHINIAWNNLTTDLSSATLPLPTSEENHICQADYRYYLNYCTFSYSMSTWTWERWQQEIDWMALHGINMPLQIVGIDVVWKNLLTKDLGYTSDEANNFIAGPCFQAWWSMNNLQGWGGDNPDWWYERQEILAKKILAREREFGMNPVLPGYSGMVPSDISSKGYSAISQGNWCGFVRPYILDPNSDSFNEIAEKYYERLEDVMGVSEYYCMDPFHEGANTDGIDVTSAYSKIAEAMTNANADGKWVIQFWQWSSEQYNVLSQVEKGELIVLDLFSDAHTHFSEYQNHEAIYCMLPNFGGRTGLFGRLTKVMTDYYTQKSSYSNIKGIGATPEAIEQSPILYDALFELPWYSTKPDPQTWVADYTFSRYGSDNDDAKTAWEEIRKSALNCETSLQGPHEAVLCARPSLQVGNVSSWGGTDIFYNSQDIADAAYHLLAAHESLSGENYNYDLTDITRQALTDYAYYLLKAINSAYTSNNQTAYSQRKSAYLNLLLDIDSLLSTNKYFLLGRWTQMARSIAYESTSTTTNSDRQWLELNNARTLITTWGEREQSESGGLRDYSYREWAGMIKDFYYPRWKTFFTNLESGNSQPDWFTSDWEWAHNASLSYSNQPSGNTVDVAISLFNRYFVDFLISEEEGIYHIYRYINTDARSTVNLSAIRGETFNFPIISLPEGVTATCGIDFNNDGKISADEQTDGLTTTIPLTSITGKVLAKIELSDGTTFEFTLILKDNITTPRTVTVTTSNASQGKVSINGTTETSVTNTEDVTIIATPLSEYDFLNWTDSNGTVISTESSYTYYGAENATFTANFIVNKWGSPTEDLSEISTIESYGQYITNMAISQNGGEEQTFYSSSSCPTSLFQTTSTVNSPQGSKFNIHWTDAGGLNYCRLSAYIDLNCDGDFDDTDELITVVGEKESANNTMLNDYTLSILLPYEVPEGITHLRLRFDGAWQNGQDATTGAMPAKAKTLRMVYDIPLNITTQCATPCTVTVKSEDTNKGTVDANGQTDTYTYNVGEEIVLRSYPSDGYVLQKWTDQYNREVPSSWMEGNFLRFYAPECGTYTAHFGKPLSETITIDGWTFSYSLEENDITLEKALSGEGSLNIPDTYESYSITSLANGALQNQKGLTSLSIPASLTSIGTNLLFCGNLIGEGVQNSTINLTEPLKGTSNWNLFLNVYNNGNSFNEWGSSLLATGSEALANSYDGGFQLYLKADGSIVLKLGSSEKETFSNTVNAKNFTVNVARTNTTNLQITVTANGTAESYTEQSYSLNDITLFSTALPTGVNLTSITVTNPDIDAAPFRGCTSLAELTVSDNNKYYKSISNVLYTANGSRLIAYPEGRLSHTLNLPSTVNTIGSHAFTTSPNLDRIVSTENTPAIAENEAFEEMTMYAQIPISNIDDYRETWGLPILFQVEANNTLSDEYANKSTITDAVEFVNDNNDTGTAPTLSDNIPLWFTYTCNSSQLLPIYFPTAPISVRVEGLATSATPISSLKLYNWNKEVFESTSIPTSGAFLLSVPTDWNGKQVTIRFAHCNAASLPLSDFSGNGTTDKLSVSTGCYKYDTASNLFTYDAASPYLPTLNPFEAILIGYEGCPTTVLGPDFTSSINNIFINSQNYRFYTPDGRQANPQIQQKGIFIREDGLKTFLQGYH